MLLEVQQRNMLCHKCLLNIANTLGSMKGIPNINIDLEAKAIHLEYDPNLYSSSWIKYMINETIITGRIPPEIKRASERTQDYDTIV